MQAATATRSNAPTSVMRPQASNVCPPTVRILDIALTVGVLFAVIGTSIAGYQIVSQIDNRCLSLSPEMFDRAAGGDEFATHCIQQNETTQSLMSIQYWCLLMFLSCTSALMVRTMLWGMFSTNAERSFQEELTKRLNELNAEWNSNYIDIATFRTYFIQKMWNTQEAKNNPAAFAEKQLSLLQQMNNNVKLREACFSLSVAGSSDCHDNAFAMFLNMQEKALEMKVCEPGVRVEELISYGLALENQDKLIQFIERIPVLKKAIDGGEGTEALLTLQLICHKKNITLPIPVTSMCYEELGWKQFSRHFSRDSICQLIQYAIPVRSQPSPNFLAAQPFWQNYVNSINPVIEKKISVINDDASEKLDDENKKLFNNNEGDASFSEVEKNMLAIEQKRKEAVVNVYLEETTRQLEAIEQNSQDS